MPADHPSSLRSWDGLLACGGSDEPTDGPSSERATDEPETPASPGRTPSTTGSGAAPTATAAPEPATEPPAASGSDETDREALVALYNAANGENWRNSANWLSDAPLGEWQGVTTNDDGRVTRLELGENDLYGEIPAELGSLSKVTWLDLQDNDLREEIPPQLGSLSADTYFRQGSKTSHIPMLRHIAQPGSAGRPVDGVGAEVNGMASHYSIPMVYHSSPCHQGPVSTL